MYEDESNAFHTAQYSLWWGVSRLMAVTCHKAVGGLSS